MMYTCPVTFLVFILPTTDNRVQMQLIPTNAKNKGATFLHSCMRGLHCTVGSWL
jgi:hypothetical protein